MTEPKRERILEKIVANLTAISAANGYWTDPKTVSRQPIGLASIDATAMPALFVTDGNETISPDFIGPAGKSVKSAFTVSILAYVEDPTHVSTLLNRLRFDVLTAILADITLGGVATGMDWTQPITIEGDLGQYMPRATFRLNVTYTYREDMT